MIGYIGIDRATGVMREQTGTLQRLAAVGCTAFSSAELPRRTHGRAHRTGQAILAHDTAATLAVARSPIAD
jgi:hypothetical protein